VGVGKEAFPMEGKSTNGLMLARLFGAAAVRPWASSRIARLTIWLGLTVLASWTLTAADAAASDAMAQVKSAVAKARQLLADPNYKSAPESKRTGLLKLLDDNFDFDDMARSSLGSYWKKLGRNQRPHFVELFHQRLERRYVKIIEDYSGAQINFLRENSNGPGLAEVYTNVVNPMLAEPLEMNYLLKRKSEAWKVYDLDIAGVSEVESYRKEYAEIINSQGYDALLKKLSSP
jgi:phospholipid transport system substrate-binding protein